jgi:hypothetical protein
MIKFFGCSFTEGGGLDNIDYYNWIHSTQLKYPRNSRNINDPNHYVYDKLTLFRNENRFSKIVSDKLGIASENFAVSRGSNDYSFEKLFNEIENNEKEIYVFVLTLISRVHWYYEPTNTRYNINSFDENLSPYYNQPIMKNLSKTYKMYLENIFNEKYEFERLETQIKLFDSYAKIKKSKIYWIEWDNLPRLKDITPNYISFNGKTMFEFVRDNELQIFHHTNNKNTDNHISLPGNKIIADIIYDALKTKHKAKKGYTPKELVDKTLYDEKVIENEDLKNKIIDLTTTLDTLLQIKQKRSLI